MKQDPYKILGVSPVASDAEIKNAYHRLAKKYHPDLRPDDEEHARQFKEINAAYDNIKTMQNKRKHASERMFNNANEEPFSFSDFNHLFRKDKFYESNNARAKHTSAKQQKKDVVSTLEVDFVDAVLGVQKQITREDGKKIMVSVPPGTQTGTKLRLRGQGVMGGDIYVELFVNPDKRFRLDGRNVIADLDISLDEAVLGGKVKVETLTGTVELMIPPNSSSGSKLRLKGRGVPGGGKQLAGDLLLILQIILPDSPDSDLYQMITAWKVKTGGYSPRDE
ncbi:MAG: DnaJ domain-containing protein [Alphaproteobacteria bacterium]|nr:DnaJ domain-containing protein [Alphaproteobacteria bacterium]